jgi:shikimate dehydrogenase
MVIEETGALASPSARAIATPGANVNPRDARAPRGVPSAASVAEFIRGTTLLYPVLGSPIAQVKAPMLYNALFARTGLDAAVVPIEIAPEDYSVVLKALFRAKNVPGAFVTIPHKAATVALLDDCSDAVRIAGACNAVVRRADGTLYGDLFDGIGFVHAVEKHGFAVAGARCLVVGAGGAGAAIAAALAASGASAIRLHDTRSAHGEALAAQLRSHFPRIAIDAGPAALAGFALIVNATPLGMEPGDPLPIDVAQITPAMVVAEIVMKREITPMLEAARARGCRIVLGREMLQEQMSLYLDFFGLPPAATDAQPSPVEPK